jgi:hypothetical protein
MQQTSRVRVCSTDLKRVVQQEGETRWGGNRKRRSPKPRSGPSRPSLTAVESTHPLDFHPHPFARVVTQKTDQASHVVRSVVGHRRALVSSRWAVHPSPMASTLLAERFGPTTPDNACSIFGNPAALLTEGPWLCPLGDTPLLDQPSQRGPGFSRDRPPLSGGLPLRCPFSGCEARSLVLRSLQTISNRFIGLTQSRRTPRQRGGPHVTNPR